MEVIRLLVQNLIVIVVLAVFLEILLPTGEMKRYVKLVMGLLVLVAILGALGSLFRGDWALALPEPALGGGDGRAKTAGLAEIMAAGRQLSQDRRTKALDEYRRSLARQAGALAGLSGEVTVVAVEVDVWTGEKEPQFGQVKEIRLTVKSARSAGAQDDGPAGPAKIQAGPQKNQGETGAPGYTGKQAPDRPAQLPGEVKNKIRTTLASFYNLPAEKVKVIEAE